MKSCEQQKISLPGCEECPKCHQVALPVIRTTEKGLTGRACQHCGAVVDNQGQLEC